VCTGAKRRAIGKTNGAVNVAFWRASTGKVPGTNPEELIAAAHASCFTMALSFALAQAGYKDGVLNTGAAVTIEKDAGGFKISKSALTLTAKVAGLSATDFQRIAAEAKASCPVSKLLDAEISLEAKLEE
jgi:lipoyl-dependent peroxiredoxin